MVAGRRRKADEDPNKEQKHQLCGNTSHLQLMKMQSFVRIVKQNLNVAITRLQCNYILKQEIWV